MKVVSHKGILRRQKAFPTSEPSEEKGRIVKRWRGKLPVCIVYPNRYYLGMSNLATHMLYAALNAEPDIVCERYFFDDSSQGLSLESNRPLSDFRILFFTLSYELDFINVPKILKGASIPVIARNRHKKNPVVIAGGICAMANPEPIHSLFDLFVMGDIEATIHDLVAVFRQRTPLVREEVIDELSSVPWIYNSERMTVRYTEKQTVDSFDPPDFSIQVRYHRKQDLGMSSILTNDTEFAGIYLVEGTRGCPSFCPFCLMGNIYPFRYDTIRSLPPEVTDVGIVGGGVSFHPRLPGVLLPLVLCRSRQHWTCEPAAEMGPLGSVLIS